MNLSEDGIDKSLSLLINALSLWMSLFDTCLTRLQLYKESQAELRY